MFEFLSDPSFLNALAAAIGPLAFFAAPTEEIENILFADEAEETGYELGLADAETAQDDALGEAFGDKGISIPQAA